MSDISIGIDLGTTNTCVAVYLNNKIEIIPNQEGGRITPSFIFVTEKDKIIVGQFAQKMAEAKPEFGICELKRLIGRKFDDPYVQKNLTYYPFKLVNVNNEPMVTATRQNNFTKSPIDLVSAILKKVKEAAVDKIGESVNKAVITVPAYFNVNQREDTLEAAKKAGLTVLKLLNEPTAAALTFYLNYKHQESYALVYDLGGGTFDVSILKRNSKNIDVVGVDGDAHLGGHDFDNLLIDYVCDHLKKQYHYNPKTDHRAMRRLQKECEDAKKTLSYSDEAIIVLANYLPNNLSIEIEVTRDEFEKMANHLFTRTIEIVHNCLENCNLTKSDINEVILSGGSTRIPQIQKMISTYFDGKKLNKVVNPDECIAEGAALQAAMISSNPEQAITAIQIRDVIPLSLGISDFVGIMSFCINRNTQIPVSETLTRITIKNNQKSMYFDVYEGERINAKKNRFLGRVTITDLTPAPSGQCEVLFTMNIDENGILKLQAKEKHRDNVKNLTIEYARGHRSDEEVKNAVTDAENNKQEDYKFLKFAKLQEYIFWYCESIMYNLEKKELCGKYKNICDLCSLVKNKARQLETQQQNELISLYRKIEQECEDVVEQYNFEFMPDLEENIIEDLNCAL